MKSYEKIEDLLEDKSFKEWVLDKNPDPEFKYHWQKWQKAHPVHAELVDQARVILLELNDSGRNWSRERKDRLFLNINQRINTPDNQKDHWTYTGYQSTAAIYTRTGLVILLLLVFVVAIFQVDFLGNAEKETMSIKQEEWIIKSNPSGQKSTITLPDGSTIFLNSESEIRFTSEFGKQNRDIYLSGESFFEVARDTLPFRVFSGNVVTTALGTSFNIISYNKNQEQIQLATGKVKVFMENTKETPIYLNPGEEVIAKGDNEMTKRKFDLEKAFLWKRGVLSFFHTPFPEAVKKMERWYAVDIQVVGDVGKNLMLSGEFEDTYLTSVLESLGYAYGFDYEIEKKEVIINFNLNR